MTQNKTLYMEDILSVLAQHASKFNIFIDVNTIVDLHLQREYTEKQRMLVAKLCQKYIKHLNGYYGYDINSHIKHPLFRSPIKVLESKKRKLSISTHEKWGKVALLEFPYDQELVSEIRTAKDHNFFIAEWIPTTKVWSIALNEYSIGKLKTIIKEKNFLVDDEFEKYSFQYEHIVNNIGELAPILSVKDGVPYIKNKPNFIPEITSTNMLSALFESRNIGITLWSEEFDDFLNSNNVNPVISTFLRTSLGTAFNLDFQKTPLMEIKDIIKYLGKILIIITNDSLLKNFEMTYQFLTDIGIQNSEISVMFRMANNSNLNKQFNKLVKDYSLNNPISDSTKIVFVNEKITKPILQSQIYFNCAMIIKGTQQAQYNMVQYAKSCPNYICYGTHRANKDLSFVNL